MSEARKKDWAEGKYTNNHLRQTEIGERKENIRQSIR